MSHRSEFVSWHTLFPAAVKTSEPVQQTQKTDESEEEKLQAAYARGVAETKADMQIISNKQVEIFERINQQYLALCTQLEQSFKENSVALVVKIASALLQNEIETNPEKLWNLIEKIMDDAKINKKEIIVMLSEHDKVLLEKTNIPISDNIKLQLEVGLSSGDIKIQTSENLLEASVQGRIDEWLHTVNMTENT